MGFGAEWINWIMECVSTVSYKIVVNGKASETFFPTKGIRQRDPLYLFIFVAEVFSNLITEAVHKKNILAIKMNRSCPILSHLFFANDSIFFWKLKKNMQKK